MKQPTSNQPLNQSSTYSYTLSIKGEKPIKVKIFKNGVKETEFPISAGATQEQAHNLAKASIRRFKAIEREKQERKFVFLFQ